MYTKIVKEHKKGNIRLWIMNSEEEFIVYFFHRHVPIPVDKEKVATLKEAEDLCEKYLKAV